MNEPHGGKLINRIIPKEELDLDNIDLELTLDSDQVSEVKNIATGIYSPLTGYMNQDDLESVIAKSRLADGTPWTIPVFLPLSKADFDKVKPGSQILLKRTEGDSDVPFAVLIVSSTFTYDQEEYVQSVYGTKIATIRELRW